LIAWFLLLLSHRFFRKRLNEFDGVVGEQLYRIRCGGVAAGSSCSRAGTALLSGRIHRRS